ncbi:anti-sigma factor [Spirosoma rhododendri]|uniref:Anti-sigma factor n=1 Tax=Spirosoma rhododendri TaxID=2728024 RepID=A0A7L5DTM2_9BACT|nr:anti-sigma factor [Spirosoma rhododendri]QJD78910.1 anti-sigma factor [Spirosoma rhododendri]
MNVEEYIASGILDSYAVGAVSDQELREVNCLASIYPEIRHELDELMLSVENYALLHSIEPPTGLRDRIASQLTFEEADDNNTIVRPLPLDREAPVAATQPYTYKTTWMVAAAAALLVLFFSYFLITQLQSNQKAMASLREANESMQNELKQTRTSQQQTEQTLAMLRQPGTRTLELRGNDKSPKGDILVFWNPGTKQVAVEVKSLPALPADKQYQLWSLVNGKPIDAGVFDGNLDGTALQKLNRAIAEADAFAVTVEKRGGSPTPSMETLLAMSPTA